MGRHLWQRIAPAVVLAAFLWTPVGAGSLEEATDFVAKKAERLLDIMGLPPGSERRDIFAGWIASTVDHDGMANRALGRYLDVATDAELRAYTNAFHNYIIITYERRLATFSGYSLKVERSRALNDNDVVVRTTISSPDGARTVVDFRISNYEGGEWRLTDFAIEGISMVKTLRDEFAGVIRRDGIEGLTALIESNVSESAL
ncbi:MAG: ABC transporter substrate-binding protein [bacterium]|nr:ABC transporter substrate-binding protein [bacterium]MDE0417770.1 ABC transporter substrate-binding protein [bacterium]